MSLAFYDADKAKYNSDPLRTFHDGQIGGSQEHIIYVRNDDSSNYYTGLVLSYVLDAESDVGEFGTTGWGIKYAYGERRPTEAEWDDIRSGEPIQLPDIGTTTAADTYTYHPIWVRVICPGGVAAQLRENQRLKLSYYERKVGA